MPANPQQLHEAFGRIGGYLRSTARDRRQAQSRALELVNQAAADPEYRLRARIAETVAEDASLRCAVPGDLDATVANMRFVKPLDADLVSRLALEHDALVTVEENVVAGGAGSAVGEALAAQGILIPLLQLGLPDAFVDHGDPAQLLAGCGLDAAGIVASVNARFGQRRGDPLAKPAA